MLFGLRKHDSICQEVLLSCVGYQDATAAYSQANQMNSLATVIPMTRSEAILNSAEFYTVYYSLNCVDKVNGAERSMLSTVTINLRLFHEKGSLYRLYTTMD